jgi:hypothetical protein
MIWLIKAEDACDWYEQKPPKAWGHGRDNEEND